MKIFTVIFHSLLIATLTILTSSCSRENPKLSALQIQESIDEQVSVAKEYLANEKNSQAISLLEDLLKQHPNTINIIEALAFAYIDYGDPSLAASYFEQIIKKAPTLHEYKIFAAQAYIDAKNFSQACRNYAHYLEFFPNDWMTWKALAKTYELDKQYAPALDAYIQAEHLTRSSSTEQDALKIARLCLRINNAQEAKTWYHLVLTHNPNSLEAQSRLLKLELQSENWPEAQKLLTKLESYPPNTVDPKLIELAKEILTAKPSSNTKKSTALASKSSKTDANTYLKEGKEHRKNKEFEKAIQSYKKALSLNPQSADAWHELSLTYLDSNKSKEAESSAKKSIDIEPDNFKYTSNHLKIVKANSPLEVLLEELNKAKERFPNNPDLTLTLAQAYHKTGLHNAHAKLFYEEFLQQAPDHPKNQQIRKILSSL